MTEDEYRDRLVKDGWLADEIDPAIEDLKQGVSFVVHEFADLADGRRLTLRRLPYDVVFSERVRARVVAGA